jgi:phosphoribosylformylglycinamidine synthase
MNFGNPQRPEIMGQFALAIEGMAEACIALDYPVVSGNVSLYNETNGKGILPTPTIGGVGVIADVTRSPKVGFKQPGDSIYLIGETAGWLGCSVFLREIHGREEGAPPPVDLAAERRNGDFVRNLIERGLVTACHDVSDGGTLVAIAEMAMASGIGCDLLARPKESPDHAFWFGEDQGRYVLTVRQADVQVLELQAKEMGIAFRYLGKTAGADLTLSGAGAISVSELKSAHEAFFPKLMGASK